MVITHVSAINRYNKKYITISTGQASIGVDSTYAHTKKLVAANGITGYMGTAVQNSRISPNSLQAFYPHQRHQRTGIATPDKSPQRTCSLPDECSRQEECSKPEKLSATK